MNRKIREGFGDAALDSLQRAPKTKKMRFWSRWITRLDERSGDDNPPKLAPVQEAFAVDFAAWPASETTPVVFFDKFSGWNDADREWETNYIRHDSASLQCREAKTNTNRSSKMLDWIKSLSRKI